MSTFSSVQDGDEQERRMEGARRRREARSASLLKGTVRHVGIVLLGLFGLASAFAFLSTVGYATAWVFSGAPLASPWDYSAIGVVALVSTAAGIALCWAIGAWVLSATGNANLVYDK